MGLLLEVTCRASVLALGAAADPPASPPRPRHPRRPRPTRPIICAAFSRPTSSAHVPPACPHCVHCLGQALEESQQHPLARLCCSPHRATVCARPARGGPSRDAPDSARPELSPARADAQQAGTRRKQHGQPRRPTSHVPRSTTADAKATQALAGMYRGTQPAARPDGPADDQRLTTAPTDGHGAGELEPSNSSTPP